MNILFTAGGRRVEIIEIFKKELKKDQIFVADVVNSSPALYVGHKAFLVPQFSQPDCLEHLFCLCGKNKVDLIIPLIDPEVEFYAKHQSEFAEKKITILVSSPKVVNIGRNKWKTFLFFKKNNIPTAATVLKKSDIDFSPIVAKPTAGSGGQGVVIFKDRKLCEHHQGVERGYIYQQFIEGDEITVDVISDGKGRVMATCQRKRLKVRAGEVERAVTIFDPQINRYVHKIVGLLKPWGVINIQVYQDKDGKLFFQEINLRLGGGCPLAYQAGVNIPKLVKALVKGKVKSSKVIFGKPGMSMLGFDRAFYLNKAQLISDIK